MKLFNSKSDNYSYSYSPIFIATMRYVLSGMLAALAVALKASLSFIPNFEIATFLLMATVLWCTADIAFLTINAFCGLNMLFFGVADWSIMYFVIFNLYGVILWCSRALILKYWWVFILETAIMGYIFGSLYALETLLLYGKAYALAYWISGFIFDLIHGSANAIIGLVFFWPTSRVFKALSKRYVFLFSLKAYKFWDTVSPPVTDE